MGFLGIYKAIYDYAPQSEGELAISEGDLLYVIEKSQDDDWWKAKKRAGGEDEDEPEGLIPNNYVEEAQPTGQARALFEYTRQTDEELSFSEDANLSVYDTSDPDWILVGLDGDFGFVPSNYIDMGDGEEEAAEEAEPEPAPRPPALPSRPPVDDTPSPALPPRDVTPPGPPSPAAPNPAAALAGVLAGRAAPRAATPPPVTLPPRPQYASDDASEDDPVSPPLPTRPRSQSTEQPSMPSPPLPQRTSTRDYEPEEHGPSSQLTPGGFHMYNINEMVSIMGKRKKMPTTLGINLKTGNILIAPERAQDGPSQEWTADKMTHYSREGKHVFMELVRPSKSVDFHAGAKDTAEEIVAALGEMAGAVRAEGLREVIMAGSGHAHKKGLVLYEFMAQGDDEVTVAAGDDVIVIDDTKSEEWWQVRRLKNGKEGVVPSSYIEITGTVPAPAASSSAPSASGAAAAAAAAASSKSTVAQNRREEERLTREAVRQAMKDESRRQSEVGPGMRLPERNSSLSARDSSNSAGQQRSRRENGRAESGSSKSSSAKSKPDPSKVRTWTDRSKSFSVEAQFLGLKDGKINLHKMNGVKIAVPIAKMSIEDLEYVERVTGISLDEDKPLSSMRKKASSSHQGPSSSSGARVGASVEPKKSDYDWFQFFLNCEIAVGLCERYAQAFIKDSMDESVLPDVDGGVLRALGLREGDIIKVMRFLDNKYGRTKKKQTGGEEEAEGGLFSGPGGTLRNNTRRGRPAPTSQASDVVDAKAFSQQKSGDSDNKASLSPAAVSPVNASAGSKSSGGFDDDAWDVKPSKQPQPEPASRPAEPSPAPAPAAAAAAPKPLTAALTGSMQDLSLLTQPLQPEKTAVAAAPAPAPAAPVAPAQAPQPTGATPSFFTAIAQQQTGLPAINGARQRPMAPQYTQGQPGLMPPPPARPLSAPQSAQPSAFGPPPLQPQMTGVVGQVAPPGQSLNEITQARMQQQYAQQMQQMQAAATMQGFQQPAMMPMMTGMPQQPGFGPNQFMMPPQPPMQSPFADPVRPNAFSPVQAQPTGFPVPFGAGQQFGAPGGPGVNSFLPPPLEPQRTGMPPQLQAQPTGMNFTQGFGNHGMPVGPGPQAPAPQPLMPQQTGPAPPVRFGVAEANKLAPQPTGRRANLSAATPLNPFGF